MPLEAPVMMTRWEEGTLLAAPRPGPCGRNRLLGGASLTRQAHQLVHYRHHALDRRSHAPGGEVDAINHDGRRALDRVILGGARGARHSCVRLGRKVGIQPALAVYAVLDRP